MATGNSEWLDTLSSIAYHWGPFFFAILFCLLVTRTARTWYVNVSHEQATNATLIEEHRKYFHYTFIFSFVLVVLSIAWYFYTNFSRYHPFWATISMGKNENVDSDQIYAREWTAKGGSDSKEIQLVVLRDHPIRNGEKIFLYYWECPDAPSLNDPAVEGPSLSASGRCGSGIGALPAKISIPLELVDATVFPQRFKLKKSNGTPAIVAEN